MRTFRRGIHPPSSKSAAGMPLEDFEIPERLYVSAAQHVGAPARPVVAPGDYVLEGQLIAEPVGFVSAAVFSPVSGEVKAIVKRPTAAGGVAEHIEIANDFLYRKQTLEPLVDPDREAVIARVREAGIVGMGGATFPTHVKLAPSKPVDTLIINAAECEPYISCDYRLLLEKTGEFLDGVSLLAKALDVQNVFIGIESNKPDAIEKLVAECAEEGSGITVVKLKTKYPQGAEKQLIYSVTRRIVPAGGLPMDTGCVVNNVHTAYAVARAAAGEPLYKRAMTVAGGGVEISGNFWVRVGTPIDFIYRKLRGGVPEEATKKVLSGGPMMGVALSSLEPATGKGTSALLFLTEKQINLNESTQCINCGRCIFNCPMSLMPRDIERAVNDGEYERASGLGVANCIECGVCSFSCPAKRPLVQAVRLAKKTIRERGIK